jgi:hypothetical protein|tara:strand:- start:2596 stop:3222 length:627 start_codon:yes stop_codon:yes gene_type:complete
MINISNETKEIVPALLSVTDKMQAEKDGKNPHFRSDYMTLDGILNTVKPILKEVGIVIVQSINTDHIDKSLVCNTRLVHISGEYIEGNVVVHADKMTPQGFGSAITYARRYGLTSVLGIAEPDDDGNAAESASKKTTNKVATPKPVAKPAAKPESKKLSEEVANNIIKAFDDIGVEIWDLERDHGASASWTEDTRKVLLNKFNQLNSK